MNLLLLRLFRVSDSDSRRFSFFSALFARILSVSRSRFSILVFGIVLLESDSQFFWSRLFSNCSFYRWIWTQIILFWGSLAVSSAFYCDQVIFLIFPLLIARLQLFTVLYELDSLPFCRGFSCRFVDSRPHFRDVEYSARFSLLFFRGLGAVLAMLRKFWVLRCSVVFICYFKLVFSVFRDV